MNDRVYESILVRERNGDVDVIECKTLSSAKRILHQMIDGRPFHDAYIRCFELDEDGNTIYAHTVYEVNN